MADEKTGESLRSVAGRMTHATDREILILAYDNPAAIRSAFASLLTQSPDRGKSDGD